MKSIARQVIAAMIFCLISLPGYSENPDTTEIALTPEYPLAVPITINIPTLADYPCEQLEILLPAADQDIIRPTRIELKGLKPAGNTIELGQYLIDNSHTNLDLKFQPRRLTSLLLIIPAVDRTKGESLVLEHHQVKYSGGYLEGFCRDSQTGEKLSNVRIKLESPADKTVTSDSEGYFKLFVPLGRHDISFSLRQTLLYGTARYYRPLTINYHQSSTEDISKDFSLKPLKASFFGTIIDSRTLVPVTGATVSLITDSGLLESIRTDSSGFFYFEKSGPGRIEVSRQGYKNHQQQVKKKQDRHLTIPLESKISTAWYINIQPWAHQDSDPDEFTGAWDGRLELKVTGLPAETNLNTQYPYEGNLTFYKLSAGQLVPEKIIDVFGNWQAGEIIEINTGQTADQTPFIKAVLVFKQATATGINYSPLFYRTYE